MKEFTIAIEETVVQEFVIVAKDEKDALETIFRKYKNREVILEDSEVQYAQMAVVNPCKKTIEWLEV